MKVFREKQSNTLINMLNRKTLQNPEPAHRAASKPPTTVASNFRAGTMSQSSA